MDTTYPMQTAAKHTGVSPHTLRYYERIGLVGPIARDAGGRRRYTDGDLGWVELLRRLRATGMSIQQMTEYAELQRGSDPTGEKRRDLLAAHERQLVAHIAELREHLGVVRHKISNYQQLKDDASP